MNIGLFIPCYINQFYPQVGIAALQILEKQNLKVDYSLTQTCCGQPMANSGYEKDAVETYKLLVRNFNSYDYVVAPSGSCVYHVRNHYNIIEQTDEVLSVRNKTFELCEFLVNVLGKYNLDAEFPFKVGLHQSCHGLRGLRLGKSSELICEDYSIPKLLLRKVKGLKIIETDRTDECCGFGGTFSIKEEAVSIKMGVDRINDHVNNKADFITATDMSCLMHLEGIIKRKKLSIGIKHIAEILNNNLS